MIITKTHVTITKQIDLSDKFEVRNRAEETSR
jgi:hypothetical protein